MVKGMVLATALLVVVGCGGEEDEVAEVAARCTRMRDHLIDLRLQRDGSTRAASVRDQHRAALTAALGDDFAGRCARNMSRAHVDCVLDAPDQDAAIACSSVR